MEDLKHTCPKLFSVFDRKVQYRYTIKKSTWKTYNEPKLNRLVSTKLQVFGTSGAPLFLAAEIGNLCGVFDAETRKKCRDLPGMLPPLYCN